MFFILLKFLKNTKKKAEKSSSISVSLRQQNFSVHFNFMRREMSMVKKCIQNFNRNLNFILILFKSMFFTCHLQNIIISRKFVKNIYEKKKNSRKRLWIEWRGQGWDSESCWKKVSKISSLIKLWQTFFFILFFCYLQNFFFLYQFR